MVAERVKRNKVFLRRLALAKTAATRRQLVENASHDELLAVLENLLECAQLSISPKDHAA